jgi:hypothetical protein
MLLFLLLVGGAPLLISLQNPLFLSSNTLSSLSLFLSSLSLFLSYSFSLSLPLFILLFILLALSSFCLTSTIIAKKPEQARERELDRYRCTLTM